MLRRVAVQSQFPMAASARVVSINRSISNSTRLYFKNQKKGSNVKPAEPKKKAGGMTHLPFRDAVRSLNFQKLAVDLGNTEVAKLSLASPVSQVFKYETQAENALNSLKAFKRYQHHEIFSNPVSLVSENTVNIREKFITNLDKPSKDNRLCLLGERFSGKSTLVAQANALALSKYKNDAVLLYIPDPENIVNGTSDYIFNKKLDKYQQTMFTKRWIIKLREANAEVFKKMPLSRDAKFVTKKTEYHLKKDVDTVYDYISKDFNFGKPASLNSFQFFIEELIHHSSNFPVLVSIDNINALTSRSLTRYFHPNFNPIHLNEFEMGHFITQVISGEINFAKGGVLLAESSGSAETKTLPVGLGLIEHDPYWKSKVCDIRIANAFLANGGVKNYQVAEFTQDETRNLLEFYDKAGALQIRPYPTNDKLKSAQEIIQERTDMRNHIAPKIDRDAEFDRIVRNAFTVSSGRPGYIVQDVKLSY